MSINRSFSGKLYDYRVRHGLTQKEMAERCGLSLRHYQDLGMGRSLPKLENAVRMAAILDISLDSLKGEFRGEVESIDISLHDL